MVGIDSEEFPSFSREEALRLLLETLVVNDEENYFVRYLIFGERIFPRFNIDPIPTFNGNDSR